MIQIKLVTKQKQAHRHGKLMVTKGESLGEGRDKLGVWDWQMQLLSIK